MGSPPNYLVDGRFSFKAEVCIDPNEVICVKGAHDVSGDHDRKGVCSGGENRC